MNMEKIGVWGFYAGLVIAVVASFLEYSWVPLVLGVLGIVVGLLNVVDKEVQMFLIATISLVVGASSLAGLFSQWAQVSAFLMNVVYFVAPGSAVVALKALYDITSSK